MEKSSRSHHRRHSSSAATLSKKNLSKVHSFAGRTAYDDVFAGTAKSRAANFSSRAEDYNEIFNSSKASRGSSIPVLDLSTLKERGGPGRVRSSEIDYAKIFGGFKDADFAVSYEELFAGPKGGESSCDEAWTPAETGSLSEDSDSFNCMEDNQVHSFEVSHQLFDAKKQFNMLYHKTNQTNREGANGTTYIAQLNAVPGFTCVIDEDTPLRRTDGNNAVPLKINDAALNMTSCKEMKGKHCKKAAPHFPDDSANKPTSGSDVKFQNGSGSNGFSLHNTNEISLKKHPNKVPSVSNISLNFGNSEDYSKRSMRSNFEGDASEGSAGSCSPPFLDEEIDANSAAAASAAAVKKAIVEAQARIRVLKESMKRKNEGLEGSVKFRFKDDLKVKEKREGKISDRTQRLDEKGEGEIADRGNIFNQKKPQETCEKVDIAMQSFAGIGMQNARKMNRVTPVSKDNEVLFISREASGGTHGKKCGPILEDPGKDGTEEREAAKQFHEFENISKYKATTFVSVQADNQKQMMQSMNDYEPEKKLPENGGKLQAAAEACEQEKIEKRLHAVQRAQEWEKIPDTTIKQWVENGSKLQAAAEACEQEGIEKRLHEVQRAQEWEKKIADTTIMQPVENGGKLQAAAEAHEHEEMEKMLHGVQRAQDLGKRTPDVTFKQPVKTGRKLKEAAEICEWEEIEKRLHVPQRTQDWEEFEKNLNSASAIDEHLEDKSSVFSEQEKLEEEQTASHEREKSDKELEEYHEALEDVIELEVQELEDESESRLAWEQVENGKTVEAAREEEVNERRLKEVREQEEQEKKLKDMCDQKEKEKELKEAFEWQEECDEKLQEDYEWEENCYSCEGEDDDERFDEVHQQYLDEGLNVSCDEEENEERLDEDCGYERNAKLKDPQKLEECDKMSEEAHLIEENDKGLREESQEWEETNGMWIDSTLGEEEEERINAVQEATKHEEKTIKADIDAFKQDELKNVNGTQEACTDRETGSDGETTCETVAHDEVGSIVKIMRISCELENYEDFKVVKVPNVVGERDERELFERVGLAQCAFICDEIKNNVNGASDAPLFDGTDLGETSMNFAGEESDWDENQHKPACDLGQDTETFAHEFGDDAEDIKEAEIAFEEEVDNNDFKAADGKVFENEKTSDSTQLPCMFEGDGVFEKAEEIKRSQNPEKGEKEFNETPIVEERETLKTSQKEVGLEEGCVRKLDEEKARERKREKDRIAVERAIREARERAYAEARERAERAAVERVTAEARQRVMAEAQERLEKASAEAKLSTEKASVEAKLRAERAAVERATAEARERALKKALSGKATFDARELADRSASEKFSGAYRDNGMRRSFSSADSFQGSGPSSSSKYSNSSNHGVPYTAERFDEMKGESAQRCQAKLERHQRTAERAAKALAEKNMRDLLAQKEQAERNRLAEALDADVKRWSSGKHGNLRALLSTLQYILGPDSSWQPIPLTDIVTTSAVKKAYRKATLCVHPDKLQQRGASIQQKYICEKVFDLLKDAWNKFNSEER
ncbi:auxilin-like protein 1 [Malania oleifera]|uniref:auxilin-like protein 1 n=1 Tax=Malania oleifera TaxID=397392 RepID=UPI0025AE3F57|nr:auxilin-like protein 1 [Malania oleifera]